MADGAVESAEDCKAAGNAAFKAGDFDEAIRQFTSAIELDPTNHVLYSNRSGAHAAKAEFKEALLDANKCIDLNKDWAKGHSRRGAAYVGLRNWPSAQAAYEKGLELDPSSTIIKEELEKVKVRRNPSSAPGYAQQHQQHQQHYAQAYAQAAQGSAAGGPQTTGMAPILSLGAVMCGFFYTVPVLGASRALLAYRMSVVFVLLLFILTLYRAFPLKMATLSDPKFTGAMEQQAFVLTVFMLLSPPMPFALMPFLSLAFLNVCHTYGSKVANLPFLGPRIVYFTTPEGTFQVLAFGAVSEVMVAFMTPMLIVLQGYRAGMLSFFFFQYVSRRYKSNPQTAQTVRMLVERIDGFAEHRFVPGVVGTLYRKAKGLVASAAQRFGS